MSDFNSQSEDENIYSVEAILKKRVMNNQNEYLIKWVGYDECTWEHEDNILDKEMIETFEKDSRQKKSNGKKKSVEKKGDEKKNDEKKGATKAGDDKSKSIDKAKSYELGKEIDKTSKTSKGKAEDKEAVKEDEKANEKVNEKKNTSIESKKRKSEDAKKADVEANASKVTVEEQKEPPVKKRAGTENEKTKKLTIDRKINTKSGPNFFNIDINVVAVEEVYKDKEENTISAKVRYKNGTYAILPMDCVHNIAPLPLIYYYESKMVFSESKDE